MPSKSFRKASLILGDLSLQIHRENQQVLTQSQVYRLNDGLEQAARAFKWSKDYAPSQVDNDMMTLATSGVEKKLEELAAILARAMQNKRDLREKIADLRNYIDDGKYPFEITISYIQFENGEYTEINQTQHISNKEEAIKILEDLEARLNQQGDIIESMLMNLQSGVQELSQLTQTISSILKMWHDTAKSIIDNIR